MGDRVISAVEEVTADWLTGTLRASGALTGGAVETVRVDTGRGNWSTNAVLHLGYSADATGKRPASVFLKMVDIGAETADEWFDDSEVRYYTDDYVDLPDAPLVHCHHAAFSPALRRYHLLLDDLTATHQIACGRTPDLAYGEALADAFGALHARWWGEDGLRSAGQHIPGVDHLLRLVSIAEPGVAPILRHCTGDLAAHWPGLLRRLYARHPQRLIERSSDPRGFTVIHGDPGCTNILVPRAGSRPIYLIDRQPFNWSLLSWLGVYDLVYAMVLAWDVEVRRTLERRVLERYHDQLLAHGVQGYSWDDLWADYRLAVPMGVYVATEYCRAGINLESQFVWLPYLQRTLTAVDDLACADLW